MKKDVFGNKILKPQACLTKIVNMQDEKRSRVSLYKKCQVKLVGLIRFCLIINHFNAFYCCIQSVGVDIVRDSNTITGQV